MTKYESIYHHLLKLIKSGKYEVGDKFVTESDMATRFNVTHLTVRQAFKLMEDQGYISRRRGKGTFVISLKEQALAKPSVTKKSIRPWKFFAPAGTEKPLKQVFKRFIDAHPQVKLEVVKRPDNCVQFCRESSEDCLYLIEFNDFATFGKYHFFTPINFAPYDMIADFDLNHVLYQNSSPVSPIVGFPLRYTTRLPVVNITLAEKLKLNISALPRTWEEVEEWCRVAKDRGIEYPLCNLLGLNRCFFHYYLSLAMTFDANCTEQKALLKEPLLEMVVFFQKLYANYSSGKPVASNTFLEGNDLFHLLAGPWFPYEHSVSKATFKYEFLPEFVPKEGAPNMRTSLTSFLGIYANNLPLHNEEQKNLIEFLRFLCNEDTQFKITTSNRRGMPCLSANRLTQKKMVDKKLTSESYYRNNYMPVIRHLIPAYDAWFLATPDLHAFFGGKITADELWQRIEWLQERSRPQEELLMM